MDKSFPEVAQPFSLQISNKYNVKAIGKGSGRGSFSTSFWFRRQEFIEFSGR
jgi:hypothetical protein